MALTQEEATKLRALIKSKINAELSWVRVDFNSRENELRWNRLQKATIALDKFIVEHTEGDRNDKGHHTRR